MEPTSRKATKRAVAYARVGRLDATDTQSATQRQLDTCRNMAEQLGVTIIEEYANRGSANDDHRPELERLLASMGSRPVDYLIVDDVCRLARKSSWTRHINDRLFASGAGLRTAASTVEETSADRLLYQVMADVTQRHSHIHSEAVNAGWSRRNARIAAEQARRTHRNASR